MFVAIMLFSSCFFLYFGLPWLFCRLSKKRLKAICKKKRAICLTFDDGPGENLTNKILELLDKYHVKASFFILGKKATKHENLLTRIRSSGHQLCSHGYAHINYWKSFPWCNIRDVKKGIDEIHKVTNKLHYKVAFRPPFGKIDIFTLIYLLIKKVPIILWTLDSGDTKTINCTGENVVFELKQGGVLLCHDFDRNSQEKKAYLLELLENILSSNELKGMRFCNISELIDSEYLIN